jgi:hypothetical protein
VVGSARWLATKQIRCRRTLDDAAESTRGLEMVDAQSGRKTSSRMVGRIGLKKGVVKWWITGWISVRSLQHGSNGNSNVMVRCGRGRLGN